MKKYITIYSVLFAILFLMLFTGGIPYGIVLQEYDDAFLGIKDGYTGYMILQIYNILIMFICLIVNIITTCSKDNLIRYKWLLSIIMLVVLAFLPIVKLHLGGGLFFSMRTEHYSLATSYKIIFRDYYIYDFRVGYRQTHKLRFSLQGFGY